MAAEQSSSRIFVRGLPPSLSEDDFKKHFSVFHSITDVRLLPHRRIGYVGYKTPQEAVKAVRHFNKSFIRMSKIGVEIAQPASRATQDARRNVSSNKNDRSQSVATRDIGPQDSRGQKRKRDARGGDVQDPRAEEFLGIMQPTSKTNRTLSASDIPSASKKQVFNGFNQAESIAPHHNSSDDEYQVVGKPKQGKQDQSHAEEEQAPLEDDNDANGQGVANRLGEAEDRENRKIAVQGGEDDDDWLRNHTNRVLDLVDEDMEQSARHQDTSSQAEEKKSELHVSERADDETNENGEHPEDLEGPHRPRTDLGGNADVDTIMSTGRLFVRNIAYDATANDLKSRFQDFGNLDEVHLPLGFESGSNKGIAFISYQKPECALQAFRELDGTIFQGRLLHILPSSTKQVKGLDDFAISKLPLKKQKLIRRKAEAATSSFNWNSLYMNADAVMSSVSDRLGIAKSTLLDPTSSDAAVKQAHAETHVIQETKSYFAEQGVNLDAFRTRERGDTAILAKNFPYEMKPEELRKLFAEHGEVVRFLVPPTGTMTIVQYAHAQQARTAFAALAYRRVRDSVLFLEKAPKELFESNTSKPRTAIVKPSTSEILEGKTPDPTIESSTLFVRNLNFDTSSERLTQVFKPLDGFLSARVKTKTDPRHPGKLLSMGFGFVEFRDQAKAQAALASMDGYDLDGHILQIRASHKGLDAAAERRREDQSRKAASRSTKIIIKNLPFEATKKDVRSLFGAYGQLRSVRVPKKFDRSARGYAFAQFTDKREAENAMESVRNTHLLGRRLVLEFASDEPEDAEAEIEKMLKKVGSQANKVELQRLTGNSRSKFDIGGSEDDNGQA
ncbi:multiple RNA-binding domain-containing protein 1 [Viridothelium virens]|uniref:Multiple RNA-binding domain-containing protein 1 n=1 Tax=Viridothelium virens TaxID=1048519 RepID=A0A6A6HD59_VIRVR|nr:multiple RNA-binding domain-containing protein 1 [Viridothelium virens]